MKKRFLAILNLLALMSAAATPVDNLESDSSTYSHPTILAPARWPGALVIAVIGWFGMAAVIGVVVQYNAPEEEIVDPSKTEPPAMLKSED